VFFFKKSEANDIRCEDEDLFVVEKMTPFVQICDLFHSCW
jgi:hypothetical protein